MKSNQRCVSVSDISSYASDPIGFCERKGGAINSRSAAWGEKMHNKAGKSDAGLIVILSAIALMVAITWLS